MSEPRMVDVLDAKGAKSGTAELPAELFDVPANIPLIHQVVTAQLAAARQGTHATKTRGEVRGGGAKPYRQKGTGRARQGSRRSPQFVGGGIVHGPQPRNYAQRTPKKMITAALRGALSDRARDGRVHVVAKLVSGDGELAGDVDAGLMAWANRFRFGLVARNLTTPEFGDGSSAIELDREVRIGGAWGSGWTGISRVVVSVDGDLMSRATPAGDRRDVAAGLETWWLSQRIGVRGGVRRSTIGEARAAVAAGVSAGLKPGMLVEAHIMRGRDDERSWSVGARMTF